MRSKIIKNLFIVAWRREISQIETNLTNLLKASNQVDSYMPPLRGCQKTLVGWRHENKFSFLHLTRVFLNNLRMFNIYQPDSFLLAFLGGSMATDFEDYKDCHR